MDLGLTYPAPGFHFLVAFELFPQRDIDVRFQEVSGLTVNVQTEEIREGEKTVSPTSCRLERTTATLC